ncbi:hypothetical protein F5Y09DRAFT_108263 [Xylaria sp. FL1042]|nr:hypothetical protein F5Y09DRAFT_108263 [Xylaria sp. FL1042]
MALQRHAHPVFAGNVLSRQERWKFNRKFGKYDFNQFRPIQASTHFLGEGNIGEMEVACKFLFQKSRWGVLNHEQNPAGIMYLDLVFTEPPGCSLRGASIVLTLDEHDEDLQHHFSVKNKARNQLPVHVTEHGPHNIVGQLKTREKLRTRQFIPSLNAGGFVELGGMGQTSKTREVQESQWRFSSQTMPDKTGHATTLRWDLSESDLDRHPTHTNTFHTAFAFQHDGQPFFIRLEVSGTLENTVSNVIYKTKKRLRKLRFPGKPQTVTTLVNFGGRNNCYTQPLDELAQTIPSEMVHANMIPVDQVQTQQTPQEQVQELNLSNAFTMQEEEIPSEDIAVSQATTNVGEEDEIAAMKENVLALMALPTRIACNDPYIHSDEPQDTPSTPPHSLGEVDGSFDQSSQTAVGTEHESEQPKIIQTSLPISDSQRVWDILRGMAVLPAIVQFIIYLVVSRIREKRTSKTAERFSPTSQGPNHRWRLLGHYFTRFSAEKTSEARVE